MSILPLGILSVFKTGIIYMYINLSNLQEISVIFIESSKCRDIMPILYYLGILSVFKTVVMLRETNYDGI